MSFTSILSVRTRTVLACGCDFFFYTLSIRKMKRVLLYFIKLIVIGNLFDKSIVSCHRQFFPMPPPLPYFQKGDYYLPNFEPQFQNQMSGYYHNENANPSASMSYPNPNYFSLPQLFHKNKNYQPSHVPTPLETLMSQYGANYQQSYMSPQNFNFLHPQNQKPLFANEQTSENHSPIVPSQQTNQPATNIIHEKDGYQPYYHDELNKNYSEDDYSDNYNDEDGTHHQTNPCGVNSPYRFFQHGSVYDPNNDKPFTICGPFFHPVTGSAVFNLKTPITLLPSRFPPRVEQFIERIQNHFSTYNQQGTLSPQNQTLPSSVDQNSQTPQNLNISSSVAQNSQKPGLVPSVAPNSQNANLPSSIVKNTNLPAVPQIANIPSSVIQNPQIPSIPPSVVPTPQIPNIPSSVSQIPNLSPSIVSNPQVSNIPSSVTQSPQISNISPSVAPIPIIPSSSAQNPNLPSSVAPNPQILSTPSSVTLSPQIPNIPSSVAQIPSLPSSIAQNSQNSDIASSTVPVPDLPSSIAQNAQVSNNLSSIAQSPQNPDLTSSTPLTPDLASSIAQNSSIPAAEISDLPSSVGQDAEVSNNPSSIAQSSQNPDLASSTAQTPNLASSIAQNPSIPTSDIPNLPSLVAQTPQVSNNTSLITQSSQNPQDLTSSTAQIPNLPSSIAQNPQVPNIPSSTVQNPQNPDLTSSTAQIPNLPSSVAQSPPVPNLALPTTETPQIEILPLPTTPNPLPEVIPTSESATLEAVQTAVIHDQNSSGENQTTIEANLKQFEVTTVTAPIDLEQVTQLPEIKTMQPVQIEDKAFSPTIGAGALYDLQMETQTGANVNNKIADPLPQTQATVAIERDIVTTERSIPELDSVTEQIATTGSGLNGENSAENLVGHDLITPTEKILESPIFPELQTQVIDAGTVETSTQSPVIEERTTDEYSASTVNDMIHQVTDDNNG